jgi:hypothetical protein
MFLLHDQLALVLVLGRREHEPFDILARLLLVRRARAVVVLFTGLANEAGKFEKSEYDSQKKPNQKRHYNDSLHATVLLLPFLSLTEFYPFSGYDLLFFIATRLKNNLRFPMGTGADLGPSALMPYAPG